MEGDVLGEVCTLGPAPMPTGVTLKGRFVTIVPMDPEAHAADIYQAVKDRPHLFNYLYHEPSSSLSEFKENLNQMVKWSDHVAFTIIDNASLKPVGHCLYLRIDPKNRVIEIGHILFVPTLQKSCGATEAMYLMMKHAIEDLGYRRYEWKCNAINEPSRRAALRLGFTFEGVFRQHMIIKGHSRDTAWFSIIDKEWPLKKKAFEQWLSSENFDDQGRQIKSLKQIRDVLEENQV